MRDISKVFMGMNSRNMCRITVKVDLMVPNKPEARREGDICQMPISKSLISSIGIS